MPNDFRALLSTLNEDRANERNYLTMFEYYRHMYAVRLLRKANITNVDMALTVQYGRHHDAAWKNDYELARTYMSANQQSLVAWNAHHYAKLACRCLDFIGNFGDPDNFSLIFMTPAMRNAVQRTLKEFIATITQRNTLDGMYATSVGTEMEVLDTMLQGFQGMRKIHIEASNRQDVENTHVDPNDVCVNVDVFNAFMYVRDTLRCDIHPEFTWNTASAMNEQIRFMGTVLSVYSSLVEFRNYRNSYTLGYGFTGLDECFETTVRDARWHDNSYKDALEAIRHMANPNQISQEVAISLLDTPVYCEWRDDTSPIYGDTDVERYLVMDYMVKWMARKEASESGIEVTTR